MRPIFLSIVFALLAVLPAHANSATFRCALNVNVLVSYSADAETAVVEVQGRKFVLHASEASSGRYSDGMTSFSEYQGEAEFITPGLTLSGCKLTGPK